MDDELRGDLAGALRELTESLAGALADIASPAYILDRNGVVAWQNPSGLAVFGDLRGRHYASVIAPEEREHVREQFARKIVGTTRSTTFDTVLVGADGRRHEIEIDSVRLEDAGEVVGVFGIIDVERTADTVAAEEVPLTPRQLQVLKMLAGGCSTSGIADRLHISRETVRNHVRHILRALGVNSRLQAVVRARELGIV
jgi:PAS domain S-box-containing protein